MASEWLTLDALQVWYMHSVLHHAGLDQTRAAEILGVDPRTLARWLAWTGSADAHPLPLQQMRKRDARPETRRDAGEREAWLPLDALRLAYIHRVVEHTRNKTLAARILGIDRRTLNRILARERARRPPPRGPNG